MICILLLWKLGRGDKIAKMIKAFTKLNKKKYIAFKSMGDKLYLSTMKYSDLVIGNSSSGIIEAPCFNIPTINIGDRQQGRLQAKSIINTKLNKLSISKSLKTAFLKKKKMNNIKKINEIKNTSKQIFDILKKTKIKNLIKKKFNDIDF